MAAYAAWMTLLLALFYLLPGGNNTVWTVVGLSSTAAVVTGIVHNRPQRKGPWILLAAALLVFISGDTLYNVFTDYLGYADPFPSVVDVLYQLFFALLATALLLLPHSVASRDRSALLDSLTVTAGFGLLMWVFVIDPTIQSENLGLLEKSASISLALWDVLLLATGTRLISTVRRTPTVLLLAVGLFGMLVSDVIYASAQLQGIWEVGSAADLGWFLCYAAWGAAALHPSMVSLTEPRTVWTSEVSTRRVLMLTLSSLIAPAVLFIEAQQGRVDDAEAIAVLSATIFLLVLLRLAGVVATHRQALARERGLREAGHALVAATSGAEVMAVVRTAVARLLPPNTHHRVVLQVAEPDAAPVGSRSDPPVTFPLSAAQDTAASASAAISIATATAAAARSRAGRFGEDGASLVPTSSLGASFAADAADFDTTLVRPLTVTDRPSGETTVGVLYLSARHESLAALRGAVEVLGSQAALALDRINLSNEITRRNSEEYFRTLVHNTSDVILILNEDDRIRYASPSANPLFGLADLTGVSLIAVIEPDDRELVSQGLAAARSGRDVDVTADWTVLNADGQRVQVEVTCRDLRTDPTVRGLVVTLRNVTERRRLERELTHRAFHDSLTGLANRVLFGERVAQAMARSAWDGRIIGVLFIDLDDFKVVNDTMGHEMGDELLVSVARKLSATLRTNDVAARLGGDEFAALIEDARDTDDVELVAERMIAMFAEPFLINGTQLHASASIGVATTADASDGRDLLRQADLALYVAKGAGKGRWRRYQSALHTAIVERLQLRAELDQAIPDGALALRFQPIVDLRTGHTNAFEALVRWYHPTRGLILPNQFIDVAEESGLIVPIGNWVLEKALDAAADWHRELADQPGPADAPYVSVNVSARQFRMPDFANRVRRELDRVGLPPSALMLEITESLLLRDDDQVWSDLTTLRQSGIRIAIDDFGTGYSSLSYLRQVPVDVVKIDRSFIDTMSSSAQQRALVEGIVRLAHTLGLKVIAEGIERISDRELLAAMGCPMGQGYLFSQPLTDNEATKWMSNDRPEV